MHTLLTLDQVAAMTALERRSLFSKIADRLGLSAAESRVNKILGGVCAILQRRGFFGQLSSNPGKLFFFDCGGAVPLLPERTVFCHNLAGPTAAALVTMQIWSIVSESKIRVSSRIGDTALMGIIDISRRAALSTEPISPGLLSSLAYAHFARLLSERPSALIRIATAAAADMVVLEKMVDLTNPEHVFSVIVHGPTSDANKP